MKVRMLFCLVCVFFGLACCGIVPSNFKSPHEEILASSGTNASIPTFENSESPNTSSSTLVSHHQLNPLEALASEFHNVSNLNHVQNAVAEEDLAGKKLPKGSSRPKKNSPKDSTRFKKTSQGKIDHAGMNITQHHVSFDDHASEPHLLQTDHKTEDLNIHGSADDHSSESHRQQTDHKTEDLKIQDSDDDQSSGPHRQTRHKTEDLKISSSVNGNFLEPHHPQTDNEVEDLKIHGSVDDHSLEPNDLQADHKDDVKINDSVDDHSPEPHHLEFDRKSDNLGFHGAVEDHFSKLDHASENFSQTDKHVSKGVPVENSTAHLDGEPEHLKDFATTFDDMLKIPGHELSNKEKDFINQAIHNNENHTEDTKHEANNLIEEFSHISDSEDLINSTKDLTHDWNNTSQEIKNDLINNNLTDFPNAVIDVTRDLNNLGQDILKDPVAAHSSDFIKTVVNFTHDSDHANKVKLNNSVAAQTNSLNEVHKNISEDLKSVSRNTSEIKNDSRDPPKTTESAQENFNHADNTDNNLLKNTVASITNSKLFLNIHNSFMRLNPTDKPNSATLKHGDETSENVISASDDQTGSIINRENLNKPSITDADSLEANALERQDITSPSRTVSDISVTESEKFSSGHTEEILINPNINNNSESIDTGTEVVNVVENKESQGLFSSLGLDFLMNSELAKNAASAMEVFNFTDSALTDHIIDDQNDMHDLLNIRSSVVDDHNLSNSAISEHINSDVDTDSSTFNSDGSTIFTGSSILDIESSTLVMDSSSVVYVSDEISEVNNNNNNNNLKETFVKEIDSSSESFGGNISFEAFTPINLNSTEKLSNVTLVPTILINSTIEFEATTNTAQPDSRNASDVVGEVKCPPPGICIFWFFAQDTCTINSHCLGSRICCRIGCSKTCVEI